MQFRIERDWFDEDQRERKISISHLWLLFIEGMFVSPSSLKMSSSDICVLLFSRSSTKRTSRRSTTKSKRSFFSSVQSIASNPLCNVQFIFIVMSDIVDLLESSSGRRCSSSSLRNHSSVLECSSSSFNVHLDDDLDESPYQSLLRLHSSYSNYNERWTSFFSLLFSATKESIRIGRMRSNTFSTLFARWMKWNNCTRSYLVRRSWPMTSVSSSISLSLC